MDNIGGFDPLSGWHPFTVLINGVLVDQRYWPVTRIKSGDVVEWRAMPQDPVTWALSTWLIIASAAISVGSLIYAMSMKKGVSGSGASAGAQGSAITSASATANQPKLFGVVRELFGRLAHLRDLGLVHRLAIHDPILLTPERVFGRLLHDLARLALHDLFAGAVRCGGSGRSFLFGRGQLDPRELGIARAIRSRGRHREDGDQDYVDNNG
jgi:hypothetical protein